VGDSVIAYVGDDGSATVHVERGGRVAAVADAATVHVA